jgi:hypothetical protein
MAALIAPIDIPAIQMDVRLGEGLVDAGLIGTECSPPCNTRATVSNGRCRFSDREIWVDVHVHGIVPLQRAPRGQHSKGHRRDVTAFRGRFSGARWIAS